MGYKVPKQIFRLTFVKHNGLEIRITAPSIGEVMSVMRLIEYKNVDPATFTDEDREAFRKPQKIFTKHLISWNMTDEEKDDEGNLIEIPVPVTLAGVESLPSPFFNELIQEWIANTMEVKDSSPLASRSLGGQPYPEEEIPMETLLASLKN